MCRSETIPTSGGSGKALTLLKKCNKTDWQKRERKRMGSESAHFAPLSTLKNSAKGISITTHVVSKFSSI